MEDKNNFFNEQEFLTSKDQLGYTEEYIVVEHDDPDDNLLLNYSLSNSLDEIEIAIFRRTRLSIVLKNACWKMNSGLSVSVKDLMKKHKVKYSMTTWQEKNITQIVVNMRSDDIWLITGFNVIEGRFYSWEEVEIYMEVENMVSKMKKDLSTDN